MINIKHIVSAVPKNYLNLEHSKKLKKIIRYSGFKRVHILRNNQTPKELINFTISKFFFKTKTDPKNIDALIFSSHTRSEEMPIFSASIQKEFKLRNNIFCYDLPNSCSGFTNALIHSYMLVKSKIAKKILIVCADAHSKITKNVNLTPIIGDGCSCILVENLNKNIFSHDFGVDGNQNNALRIETKNGKKNLVMDGLKVFEFAIKRVPETIKKIVHKSKHKLDRIDYFSFHQPNKTMLSHLLKKLYIKNEKVISTFQYGNTSSPSIPISLSSQFPNKTVNNKKFIFCGFGSGFQWSTVLINLKKTLIYKVYYL